MRAGYGFGVDQGQTVLSTISVDAAFNLLAQAQPWVDSRAGMPVDEPGIDIGHLMLVMISGGVIAGLFGWWGKTRAEEHNVNPWIGFAAGFCFGWIGVRLVPLMRSDRIYNKRQPDAAAFAQSFGGHPPQGAWPPMPSGPPAAAPQPAIVVDKDGYFECPACAARVKQGRRSCMSCGTWFSD
jgi:hypothetical protein